MVTGLLPEPTTRGTGLPPRVVMGPVLLLRVEDGRPLAPRPQVPLVRGGRRQTVPRRLPARVSVHGAHLGVGRPALTRPDDSGAATPGLRVHRPGCSAARRVRPAGGLPPGTGVGTKAVRGPGPRVRAPRPPPVLEENGPGREAPEVRPRRVSTQGTSRVERSHGETGRPPPPGRTGTTGRRRRCH